VGAGRGGPVGGLTRDRGGRGPRCARAAGGGPRWAQAGRSRQPAPVAAPTPWHGSRFAGFPADSSRAFGLPRSATGHLPVMVGLIVTLLIIWAILAVLGLAIKGLFWLFIIGLVLFIATGVMGWVRRRT
jgi:hypothetical protein